MTDPYVEKIIEENEERKVEHENDGKSKVEEEVDGFFEPVFDAINRLDGADREKAEIDRIENDASHRREE